MSFDHQLSAAESKAEPPTILALDLGTNTGWALRNRNGAIVSGVVAFRPGRFEGAGMAFLRFGNWLDEMVELSHGLNVVVFEKDERLHHAGAIAAQVYGGFLAHLTAWCEHQRIPYQGVPVSTMKRRVSGNGAADKEAMVAAIKAKGHCPKDHNEADALAILYWALAQGLGGRS